MKITKLICPSCEGSGVFSRALAINCTWCRGDKRLPVADALRYADTSYMIAGGGYVAGDFEMGERIRLEGEAERIYSLAQVSPPWAGRAALQEKEAGE